MTKVPYLIFMKHAQKVVRGRAVKTRPVLGGVIHRDNYVAVTDSHRLYYAEDIYDGKDEKNVSPITGEEIKEGNYPNVLRILPSFDGARHETDVDVTAFYETIRAIEIVSRIDKSTDMLKMNFEEDFFSVTTGEEAASSVSHELGERKPEEAASVYASIKYVKEALMLFKEAKIREVAVRFYGNVTPFAIVGGNLTVVITPIRRGGR